MKSDTIVSARIVRNISIIALYTNCHCQKTLEIISMALLIGAMIVKTAKENKKR